MIYLYKTGVYVLSSTTHPVFSTANLKYLLVLLFLVEREASFTAFTREKTDMVEILHKEAGKMGHPIKKGKYVPLDG